MFTFEFVSLQSSSICMIPNVLWAKYYRIVFETKQNNIIHYLKLF